MCEPENIQKALFLLPRLPQVLHGTVETIKDQHRQAATNVEAGDLRSAECVKPHHQNVNTPHTRDCN